MAKIYKNGNYTVLIFKDGTKVRRTEADEFIPAFAENCDVKITDKCDGGCPFCYEGCTVNGPHADLFKYDFINSLHPYTEMALNGNDLTHPDIDKFLEFLKEKQVFANMTVNQKHFMKYYDRIKEWVDKELIYGVGISLNSVNDEFVSLVKTIPNAVIHTINGILTKEDVEGLKNKDLKILVLGYKELRRGVDYLEKHSDSVTENQSYLFNELPTIIKENWFKVVSFDNLAIKQLDVKRLMTQEEWEEFYMGDDGGYTFYIDMVKGEYSQNSLSQTRYPIGNKTIDEMFSHIRSEKLKGDTNGSN